jgi:hypothetical protein
MCFKLSPTFEYSLQNIAFNNFDLVNGLFLWRLYFCYLYYRQSHVLEILQLFQKLDVQFPNFQIHDFQLSSATRNIFNIS